MSIFVFFVISPSFFQNIPKSFVVVSGSMEPLIKSGSLVFVKPINPNILKTGDIIAFASPNNSKDTILHRINLIKSTNPIRFSTKGDNNNTIDQWDVVDVGVIGRYQFSIPYIGYIVALLRRPLGFIFGICLPAGLLIISEIFKIKNNLKKKFPKIIIQLLLFISIFVVQVTKSISAFYTSTSLISGITFSIGELTPPESSIDLMDISTKNIHNFNIMSTADDNESVAYIQLYYSFNYNSWQLFSETIYGPMGNFHFTSPEGDGLYSFESVATDSSGNVETKDFDYYYNQIKVDTIPPTTNLDNQSLPNHICTGQDYLINGNFENGMVGWQVSSSIGDHHIINNGDLDNNVYILGSEAKTINGTDSFYQTVSLPASASSTLKFSYHFFSHDIADYDHFNVDITDLSGTNILENILNFGNLNTDDYNYDSGWITLSRSLTSFAGQTFKLLFSLTDTGSGDDYNSWVYLDNINIFSLDTRVGETSIFDNIATDLGSDIASTSSPIILVPGENIVSFSSTDSAQNTENIHHQSIVVLPPLVLNKISQNIITLFNNSQSETVDLSKYSYVINSDLPISLSGTLSPMQSFNIILSTPISVLSEIKLFVDGNLVDSTTVSNLGTSVWQRIVDGLGPWVMTNSPPFFNLESRLSVSKITLSISGLSTTLSDMSYTIDYSDISGPQQIYGQILPNAIDTDGVSTRDFYLGTCSSGGTCVSSSGLGSSFTVTFSDLPPKTFIFNL